MRTQTTPEPSGVRLLRLINTRILEIANREIDNTDRLRLYGTGGYWTAFDRSAFQLSRLFPDLDSFVVNPPGAPFTVVGLTVTEKDLKRYMKKARVLRQGPDYLEFAATPFFPKEYNTWHTQLVNDYSEFIQVS